MKISHANQMKIQRRHRLGSPRKGTRLIIIRFAYFGDRENVKKGYSNLKDQIYLLKRTSAKKYLIEDLNFTLFIKQQKNFKMKVKLVADCRG